ncbi:hypothetical protein A2U01_0084538, partial [Trifolium medium]|nr:hypothetical protein [Trifolium medium]
CHARRSVLSRAVQLRDVYPARGAAPGSLHCAWRSGSGVGRGLEILYKESSFSVTGLGFLEKKLLY